MTTSEYRLPGRTAVTHRPPARLTVFTTPVVGQMLRWLSIAFLWFAGWTTEVIHPGKGSFVFTAAPHTSYWDGAYMLAAAAKERIPIHWFTTEALFRGPLGPVMRWLGAIPVDRSQRTALVDAAIAAFSSTPNLILGIAPEGTRYRVDRWKTGFHRIARGAGVPVVPGFLDYRRKVAGTGAAIAMTESSDDDLATLKSFYGEMEGRNPDQFDPEAIRFQGAQG